MNDYTEDKLAQQTLSEYLEHELGWNLSLHSTLKCLVAKGR